MLSLPLLIKGNDKTKSIEISAQGIEGKKEACLNYVDSNEI
jgi:hypothetical protein